MIGVDVLGDRLAVRIAHRDGVTAAEPEIEVRRLIEHEVSARGQHRAGRQRSGLGRVLDRIAVHHGPAGDVDGGRTGVEDLDPVGRVAVRLDLVDHDVGCDTDVGCSWRRHREGERPFAVDAAGQRGGGEVAVDRSVAFPGESVVDERA